MYVQDDGLGDLGFHKKFKRRLKRMRRKLKLNKVGNVIRKVARPVFKVARKITRPIRRIAKKIVTPFTRPLRRATRKIRYPLMRAIGLKRSKGPTRRLMVRQKARERNRANLAARAASARASAARAAAARAAAKKVVAKPAPKETSLLKSPQASPLTRKVGATPLSKSVVVNVSAPSGGGGMYRTAQPRDAGGNVIRGKNDMIKKAAMIGIPVVLGMGAVFMMTSRKK